MTKPQPPPEEPTPPPPQDEKKKAAPIKRPITAKEAYEIAREVADAALKKQRIHDDTAPCPGVTRGKNRLVIGEPWAVKRAHAIVGHFEEFTTPRGCVHADGIDLRCLIASNIASARAEGYVEGMQAALRTVLGQDDIE